MKILFILLFISNSIYACEICGCSISSAGLGILPNYQNHFSGLRYKYSSYETLHPDDNTISNDYYNQVEVWGRFVVNKKIQIFGFVPFVMNTQHESGVTNTVKDFGDASIVGNYMLLNQNIDSTGDWKHFLQAGGGVKFPTGKYDLVQNQHTLLPNLQPGTGTFDVTFNALYVLRYKSVGINLDVNYRINTKNRLQYQQGNKTNISTRLFYLKEAKNMTFIPHLGLDIEGAAADIKYQSEVEYTGNKSLLGNIGLDIFYKKVSLGISTQVPISQTINSGYTTNPYRVSTQLIYFFNSTKNTKICQL